MSANPAATGSAQPAAPDRAAAVAGETGRAGGAATTGSGRVGNVDALRACAALGVLAAHAYSLGGRAVPIKAQFAYDVPIQAMTTGVWLFFAISGFVIGRPFVDRLLTGRPLPELVPYALRRALRIFPLYWATLTAVILLVGVAGTRLWQIPFHYALLQNLVPGQQEALLTVAWTLTIEVLFYVAVPVLVVAVRRGVGTISAERLAGWVLASWAVSALLTLLADLGGATSTAAWARGLLPMYWQMFCPGILVAIAPHLRDRRWRRWLVDAPARPLALLVAAALIAAGAIIGGTAPLRFGAVPYVIIVDATRPLFAIGYGLVLIAAINARPWSERFGGWVLRLGLVSYGIYLWHAVLVTFFHSSYGDGLVLLPHDGLGQFVIHVAFLTGLTVPIAMASWAWFERPLIDLSAMLSERWRASRRRLVSSAA